MESATGQPAPAPPRIRSNRVLLAVGWLMLVAWGLYWSQCAIAGRLLAGDLTWIPAFNSLGLDFLHNYLGVRFWLEGGNPYLELFGDPMGIPYNYAPVVLMIFIWCGWLSLVPAALGWIAAVAAMVGGAAAYGARVRRALGEIAPLPVVFCVAAILCCTPTLFSMERGNCDALVVLMLIVSAVAMGQRTLARDAAAGIALALAAVIKVYPGLTIFAPLALRRSRVTLLAIAATLLISAATPAATLEWLHNIRIDAAKHQVPLVTHVHTISGLWFYLAEVPGLSFTKQIPRLIPGAVAIVPLLVWVSLAIDRSDRRDRLAWPWLLFVTQAATFWSPVSYDYKLFFMALAILAVYDRRDPWPLHILVLPFLLYWQPLRIAWLGPVTLLAIKYLALVGIAALIARRAHHRGTPSISGPA